MKEPAKSVLESNRNSARAPELFEFTQGIEVDRRLAVQEIRVQQAWARALGSTSVMTAAEAGLVIEALAEADRAIAVGTFEWRVADEDVHMNLERFVTERRGALGKRMHFGRSRNDLIATTLRLFVSETVGQISCAIAGLIEAFAEQATSQVDVIVPGLTHLQHGQPVRLGHVLAGHGWALSRDLGRLASARRRAVASMPLGSAALAGTSLTEIDLSAIARELGFAAPSLNSYDSVGDRDFMIEAMDAYASVAVHISRLCEDVIFWSSSAVGLAKLPKDWSTGSSIMPNKRNPDVAELARAKATHVMAAAANGHTLMKAVATSYGSDLHELKGVYLRAFDELKASLLALTPFVRGLAFDAARASELCRRGQILATEVADELARQGVPFREAYSQVAALVELAETSGRQISELPAAEWARRVPAFPATKIAQLGFESAVEARSQPGGTARARVLEGIAELRASLRSD